MCEIRNDDIDNIYSTFSVLFCDTIEDKNEHTSLLIYIPYTYDAQKRQKSYTS